MITNLSPAPLSKVWVWTGRVLSGLIVVFMLVDGIGKVLKIQPVLDAFAEMNFPVKLAVPIGLIDIVCAVLFAIPRTAVLGAVLLTGLLGGAIATHFRLESPLFSHTLFGLYLGLIAWGALYLREPRLRALLPLNS